VTTQNGPTELPRAPGEQALLQAAFRDVHAARIHGFALIVTLGNHGVAAGVAARAVSEGCTRLDEMRHPERAAAWLRNRVLRLLPRDAASEDAATGDAVLSALGLAAYAVAGLRAVSLLERVALVVADLERLDSRDVATVVNRDGEALAHLLARARRRYLEAALQAMPEEMEPSAGPLRTRIANHAWEAMGGGAAS
jgi:hypothetical protein